MPTSMTPESYLAYSMSSTRIEVAIAQGASERDIRDWCSESLAPVFGGAPIDVLFEGYVAYVRHRGEPGT
jgi:hypothetical protein